MDVQIMSCGKNSEHILLTLMCAANTHSNC